MAGITSRIRDWFSGADVDGGDYVEPARGAAPVRPVASIMRRRGGETGQIHTIDVSSYAEAKDIAALYRENIAVIVNMGAMTEPDARRLLDFMLGLKEALLGDLQRVAAKVYLLAPATVGTNNEEDGFESVGDGLVINPAR